jgi:hypothetical protein
MYPSTLHPFYPVNENFDSVGVTRIEWIFLQMVFVEFDSICKLEQLAPTENGRFEMMETKWILAREVCEFMDRMKGYEYDEKLSASLPKI